MHLRIFGSIRANIYPARSCRHCNFHGFIFSSSVNERDNYAYLFADAETSFALNQQNRGKYSDIACVHYRDTDARLTPVSQNITRPHYNASNFIMQHSSSLLQQPTHVLNGGAGGGGVKGLASVEKCAYFCGLIHGSCARYMSSGNRLAGIKGDKIRPRGECQNYHARKYRVRQVFCTNNHACSG